MDATDSLRGAPRLASGGLCAAIGGLAGSGLSCLCRCARAIRIFRSAHVDLGTVLQFVEAVGGDNFPGLESVHGSGGAIGGARGDGAEARGVIALDDVDKGTLGVALNRGRGKQSDVA